MLQGLTQKRKVHTYAFAPLLFVSSRQSRIIAHASPRQASSTCAPSFGLVWFVRLIGLCRSHAPQNPLHRQPIRYTDSLLLIPPHNHRRLLSRSSRSSRLGYAHTTTTREEPTTSQDDHHHHHVVAPPPIQHGGAQGRQREAAAGALHGLCGL